MTLPRSASLHSSSVWGRESDNLGTEATWTRRQSRQVVARYFDQILTSARVPLAFQNFEAIENFHDTWDRLAPDQRAAIQNRLGVESTATLLNLSREGHPGIFFTDFRRVAYRFRQDNRIPEAIAALTLLAASAPGDAGQRLQSTLGRIREDRLVILGEGGSFGRRVEFFADQFMAQAFDPATVLGMASGQLVFAGSRAFFLSRLLRPSAQRFVFGAWGTRTAAATLATVAEVPVFWGVSKGIHEWQQPGVQSWNGSDNLREMGALAMTLGILRSVHFGSSSLMGAVARQPGALARPWITPFQQSFPHAATIGGLFLAHTAEESLGLRDESSIGQRWLDAFVMYLQFGVTGRLANGLLGSRFQSWRINLESKLQTLEQQRRLPSFRLPSLDQSLQHLLLPGRQEVLLGVPSGILAMSEASDGRSRPMLMAMSTLHTGEGTNVKGAAQGVGEASAREVDLPFLQHVNRDSARFANELIVQSQSRDDIVQLALVRELEGLLLDPQTRDFTRDAIESMKDLTRHLFPQSSAVVREYQLPGLSQPLTVFSPVTTFLPEAWSQFFARQVVSEIHRYGRPVRRAVELGTGTGWLSIYLRKLGLVERMDGGDYTETAPHVSRINALLNEVDGVSFYQSDLWKSIPRDQPVDLVVACIPQIPSVDAIVSQRDFADYTPARDNIMKPYGLGLIHDALRESEPNLAANGRILLNLAGRPGLHNLFEMFRRTGFHPVVREQGTILQDVTTDISPLAALESRFPGVRFQFLPPAVQGEAPISAIAAQKLRAGDPQLGIRHHQYLIEGRPYRGYFENVFSKSGNMPERGRWAYTPDSGTEHTETRLAAARFLSREWGTRLSPEGIFIGPQHETLLTAMLRVEVPKDGRVAWYHPDGNGVEALTENLPEMTHAMGTGSWRAFEQSVVDASPNAIVLRLPRLDWNHGGHFGNFLNWAASEQIPVIVLEAYGVRESDGPSYLVDQMRRNPEVRANTILVQSLDQRFGVSHLPMSIAWIGNKSRYQALARYAELTYSRVSTPVQLAYAKFFESLPNDNASIAARSLPVIGELAPVDISWTPTGGMRAALENLAAFASGPQGSPRQAVIEMNFGESEWQAPVSWNAAYRQVARNPNLGELRATAEAAVLQYLQESRGIQLAPEQVALGYGVQPLLHASLRSLAQRGPIDVWVPQSSYGLFYPTVQSAGGRLRVLPTDAQHDYLVTPAALAASLDRLRVAPRFRPVLLLNIPTNPAGRYYSEASLAELSGVLRQRGGTFLLDDIFGLLNLRQIPFQDSPYVRTVAREMGNEWMAFGGLAKEFAAGGVRLGWAYSSNSEHLQGMRRESAQSLDALALAMAPEYLAPWKKLVPVHQNYLASNRRVLTEVLDRRHISYHDSEGGYSLLADFSMLWRTQRSYRMESGEYVRITPENFHDLLYSEAGLKIYAPEWSQTPGRYRLVFSIERIDEAATRLDRFLRRTR